jgi:hypothetical protein
MLKMNKNNEANELLNKLGKWKQINDVNDELSILEAIVEMADQDEIELDVYTDILSDSTSFKSILREDMTARGLLYEDGVRVKKATVMDEW